MKATSAAIKIKKAVETLTDQVDALERRLITIEAILEVMLTPKQRERLNDILAGQSEEPEAEDEPEETQ